MWPFRTQSCGCGKATTHSLTGGAHGGRIGDFKVTSLTFCTASVPSKRTVTTITSAPAD
ncbi:protein of unknown function [Paraburkholderia kururiensis]